MLKVMPVLAALALAGCGAGDPYAAKVPSYKDTAAAQEAVTTVKPEDKPILFGYFFRKRNEDTGLIRIKPEFNKATTVREAIDEQKRAVAQVRLEGEDMSAQLNGKPVLAGAAREARLAQLAADYSAGK